MEPPSHHYHLYVPSSCLAIVSGRAQKDTPKVQRFERRLHFYCFFFSCSVSYLFFFFSLFPHFKNSF